MLLAPGVLVRDTGEVGVGADSLKDHLEPLRQEGFKLADGRYATSLGQPAVAAGFVNFQRE
jgi:hypothetical protein